MRLVVQRSLEASVKVDNKVVGAIDSGLVVLVGFTHTDTVEDLNYLVDKLINLRIFDDEAGIMNRSILDVGSSILSISQFTLYADTKKGRRPSYTNALESLEASKMYDLWNNLLKQTGIKVETGIFQAEMQVSLINDGPITIILESRKKNV